MLFKDSRPTDEATRVTLRKSVIQAATALLAQHSNYAAERAEAHEPQGRDLNTNTEDLLLPTTTEDTPNEV